MDRILRFTTIFIIISILAGCHLIHDYGGMDTWQTLGSEGFTEGSINTDAMAIGKKDGRVVVGLIESVWDESVSKVMTFAVIMQYIDEDNRWEQLGNKQEIDTEQIEIYKTGFYIGEGIIVVALFDKMNNIIHPFEFEGDGWKPMGQIMSGWIDQPIQIHIDEANLGNICIAYAAGGSPKQINVLRYDWGNNMWQPVGPVIDEWDFMGIDNINLYVYGEDIWVGYTDAMGMGPGIRLHCNSGGAWMRMNDDPSNDINNIGQVNAFDLVVDTGQPIIAYQQSQDSIDIWMARRFDGPRNEWVTLGDGPFSYGSINWGMMSRNRLFIYKTGKSEIYAAYSGNDTIVQKAMSFSDPNEQDEWKNVVSEWFPQNRVVFIDISGNVYFLYKEEEGTNAGKATVKCFGNSYY